jgi:dihydrodipicolinate reductase
MRMAVAGATGRIGQLTVEALERAGHDAVPVRLAAGRALRDGAATIVSSTVAPQGAAEPSG